MLNSATLAAMYGKIKQLRQRGIRRSDREINSDPGTDGEFTFALVGGIYELKLAAPDDSQLKPVIPILYDAKLITMHGDKMLFKGEERAPGDNGPSFVQEWAVLVMPRG